MARKLGGKKLTGINPLAYMGVESASPSNFVRVNRAPTISDTNHEVGTRWIYEKNDSTVTNDIYTLVDLDNALTSSTTPPGPARWILIGSGSGDLVSLTGDSGGAVTTDASNNININGGDLITVVGTPTSNVLTPSLDNSTNGKIIIASTAGSPAYASVTSEGSTIAITEGSNSLNLETGTGVAATFATDSGNAVPAASIITIAGGTDLETSGAGSTVTIGTTTNAHAAAIHGWNGAIIETAAVTVASDGATITLSVQKSGGGNLTVIFSDGFYDWTTAPDTIALTAGSDTSPQENYVYLLQSNKTLTVDTSSFPAGEHAPIATVTCQSAASLAGDGAYKVHAWTDHVEGTNDQGHISHVNHWIRDQFATWESGVAPTLTITPNGGAPDNVIFTSASGEVYQLHEHTFPAFAGTPDVYVVNNFATNYSKVTDLNTQLIDSQNVSLSNKYFSLVIWGVVSEAAADCKLMCNLPSGSYNSSSMLTADASKYTDFSMPADFKGAGFLIAQLNLRHQAAASGTWTEIELIDLRGQIPSIGAGGATVGQTEFPDNTFRILDDGDNTKEIAFEASGITTATTRTMTVQDASGTIAYLADIPGGSITWSVQTGATKAMVVNEGYFANRAGADLALTLPATAAVGDTMEIALMHTTGTWSMAQNAGQTCYIGNTNTTTGAGGSLASSAKGDWIEIICRVADVDFQVNIKSGNPTIV